MALLTVAHMIDLSVKPVEMVAAKHSNGYTLCYRYTEDQESFDIALNARQQEKVYKSFESIWDDVQRIDPGSNLMVINEME